MNIDEIKEMFPSGTVVELENMAGESQMPYGLRGEVRLVDDIGQIHVDWENGSSLALNFYEDSFRKIDGYNKISVLLVEPNECPKVIEIDNELADMQRVVGGMIEEYMAFDDDVAIVCNEEGKIRGLPLNRGIFNEKNELMDVIAGTFFIAYAPVDSEEFKSLPKDLEEKYMEKFKNPERFIMTNNGLNVAKAVTKKEDLER